MIFAHILVFLGLLVLNLPVLFNPAAIHGFTYGDPEVTGYIAYLVGNGAKLFQDFSMIYAPGRFIALAALNKSFGVEFSIPLLSVYGSFIAGVLVPFGIYLASFMLLNQKKSILRFFIALIPMLMYLLFLRSGQDVHAAILLFVAVYAFSKEKPNRYISVLAGFLWMLIGFFRIEAGIIAFIAVVATEFIVHKKEKNSLYLYGSYLFFQLCYFLLIVFHGSLNNFFHDVVQLGIIAQPKLMKVLILPANYPLFEFFLLLNVAAALIAIVGEKKPFILLSLLSLLGYANALGRADFDHLYYGIVLAAPGIILAGVELVSRWKEYFTQKISLKVLLFALLFVALAVLTVKKQSTYLLLGFVPLLILSTKMVKKQSALIALFILIVAFTSLIRSQSLFVFYAKRQFALPRIPSVSEYKQIPLYFSEVKKGNYGGFILSAENEKALGEMKKDLAGNSLFIYPSHVTLYHALGKKPPIRYFYFNHEYTKRMEDETVQMLQNEKIEYVLVSYNLTKKDAIVPNQTINIQNYIDTHYTKVREYAFGNDTMVLMKRM